MKELELKLTSELNLGEPVVSIDDKPVKFKKNEFGNLVCKYQTENDKVNIKVYRALDVGRIVWFITQLFFFLISIFGLLDIHRKEKCLVIDFETDFELNDDNKITLQVNYPEQDKRAITIQSNLQRKEVSNKYYVDTKAKKTLKALMWTKLVLALAIIATIIIVILV